ncbi:MAG: GNAT family N-acetyltransferase [Candidatus Bathyarchaeia archaeon]
MDSLEEGVWSLTYKVGHKPGMFHIRLAPGKYSYLKYSIEGGDMKILSTYTPEEFRGRGLAALLMEEALKYAKENNLRVVPECSYARYYLEKRMGQHSSVLKS